MTLCASQGPCAEGLTPHPRCVFPECAHKKPSRCSILCVVSLCYQWENSWYSWNLEREQKVKCLNEYFGQISPGEVTPLTQRMQKTQFRLHLKTQTIYSTTVKVPSSPVCSTNQLWPAHQHSAMARSTRGIYCKANAWTHIQSMHFEMYLAPRKLVINIIFLEKFSLSAGNPCKKFSCSFWVIPQTFT